MEAKTGVKKQVQTLNVRQWMRLLFVYLLIPVSLFICAGDLSWWQAWVYSLLIVAAGFGGRILAERQHPGLLVERVNSFNVAEGVKPWDKVLAPLMAISVGFPLVIVAGLDHRFRWSAELPLWLIIIGFTLVTLGYSFACWAMVENSFFSGVVRIQTDRGHVVCDSGPYRIVRHPGYGGNIVALAGIVLALSSIWTIVPAMIAFVIAVVRTVLEDRTLQEELPGYKEYAQRVRYRLIPGLY